MRGAGAEVGAAAGAKVAAAVDVAAVEMAIVKDDDFREGGAAVIGI